MTSDLLRELLQATLAGSAAVALVLWLRRPLRVRFGAQAAYRAWALVPCAMLAVCVPAPSAPMLAGANGMVGSAIAPVRMGWAPTGLAPSPAQAGLLAGAWVVGVALCGAWFALRQRRFDRLVERRPGSRIARVSGHGPAVVGAWRSRIVLPDDFRQRYTRAERRLVLAHEVAHLRRGDVPAQALATGLRCLFWFNPVLHLAAARFRFDQELACDATVIERFPRGRARYGNAMLKTQLAGFGLPVGCHWPSRQPLKERIEMLKQPLPARTRRLSGAVLVAALMSAGAYAAWAAQPAAPAPSKAARPATPLVSISDEDDLGAPAFPVAAGRVNGQVLLELLVGVDGSIKDVKVIQSEPAGVFDAVTVEAARKWHIKPRLENGVAVEGWVRVPVDFRADDKAPTGAEPR